MTEQWSLPAYALLLLGVLLVVLAVAVLVLLLGGLRAAGRTRVAEERLRAVEADAAALREAVGALERRAEPRPQREDRPDRSEFVITRVGDPEDGTASPDDPAPVVAAPLFADLVLRESVVQAASLAAGVRRALAPETRNRVRFEMRREVKRARRQRRSDLRAARRAWTERERHEGSAA